jgi:hypothetical protein
MFSPSIFKGRSSVASKGKQWEWNIQVPGGNNFFCSIVTGMDSQQERKDISQREELSSFCEGFFWSDRMGWMCRL